MLLAMEVLDGDDVRLTSRGRAAERDIVQVGLNFQRIVKQFYQHKQIKSGCYEVARRSSELSNTYYETLSKLIYPPANETRRRKSNSNNLTS